MCARRHGVFIMPQRKILVMEHNEKDQRLLRFLITRFGHEPLIVCNEEQCLVTAKKDLPDLLLINTDMPVEGGMLNLLRGDDGIRRIPAIAIVDGTAERKETNGLLAQGYAGYISKPFDIQRLDEAIQGALPAA